MAAAELQLIVSLKDEASKNLKGLGDQLGGIGKVAAGVATALAAAGAAAATFAAVSLKKYAEVGDEVEKMAERTGLAAEEVSALRVAAEASGTSIETVEGAIKKMALNMVEAADGTSVMSNLLDGFGISIDEFKARTPAQQFEDLALSIGSITDPTARTQAAIEAFGKAGADLIPLMEDGNFSMEAWRAKAKELGVSFDDLSASKAAKLNDAMGFLQNAFDGVKFAIADLLAQPVADWLTEATSKFGEIRKAVEDAGGVMNLVANTVRDALGDLFRLIEDNTGLITVLTTAWENVAVTFRELLLPQLQRLWEQLKPLEPFLKVLAQVVGTILIGALIALVKLIEVSVLVAVQSLTFALDLMNKGIDIVSKGWNAFIDILARVVTWIDKVIEKMKNLDIVKGAVSGVQNILGFGGARAEGGPVSPGQAFLVGERGPELFVPSSAGTIVPNGGGTTLVVNVTGNTIAGDQDTRRIALQVGDIIIDRLKLHQRIGA